jgi:hypothetical protein
VVEGDKLKQGPLELEAWLHDADELAETLANHHVLLGNQHEGRK